MTLPLPPFHEKNVTHAIILSYAQKDNSFYLNLVKAMDEILTYMADNSHD